MEVLLKTRVLKCTVWLLSGAALASFVKWLHSYKSAFWMTGTPLASTNIVASDSWLKETDKLCGDLGGSFCLMAEE